MKFNLPKENSSIIKVIGVGGGGSNAVNHMFKQGIKGVDFIVCNTDAQALDLSPVPIKVQLGTSLTEGRGAGSQPEMGRNAAIETIEEIRNLLSVNTKMVFITAGMGGGTGTGAAPVIAQTARELGILTVGIVTIPFTFEGKKRRLQAEEGLRQLKSNVDTLLIICNDRLREMYGNLKIRESFSKADDILTTAAKGIAEVITVTGTINVDFEDVKTVMKESGVAIMGSSTAEGEGRALKSVQQALSSPLLNDDNIKGARYVLLNITYGSEEILMDEISDITDYIQEEAGQTADVIWGHGMDESLGNKICVTVIATGFTSKLDSGSPLVETKKVVNLNDDSPSANDSSKTPSKPNREKTSTVYPTAKPQLQPKMDLFAKPNPAPSSFEMKPPVAPKAEPLPFIKPAAKVELPAEPVNKETEDPFLLKKEDFPSFPKSGKKEEPKTAVPFNEMNNEKVDKVSKNEEILNSSNPDSQLSKEELQKKATKRIQTLKDLHQKYKSPAGIAELEKLPAFMRKGVSLEDTPHSSESEVSRFTLSEEDNGEGEKRTEIKPNNPYLHDNVD